MTTSARFCLSYDSLKRDFIVFKMNISSIWKCIVDMDVVNDVTCTRQSVITRVVRRFVWHDVSTEQQRHHMIKWIKSCILNRYETTYCLTLGYINPYFSSGHQFVYVFFWWNLIHKHSESVLKIECSHRRLFIKPSSALLEGNPTFARSN